eukprot:CAMPEP_0197671372 /NCGR_PEP_ID=MMETSP1338-20131121/76560_1 /TAXON_ID=43686 ORGANISM="Pelagodinium beii, Strain RCC1491" /NCGR_SAMPLE_ID=MMETSP1338 /ASSEMBLY_ACC=CAM_ASM_000754 /LENGTH=113 /DNA_ID=CAMNT_0043251251 /DNA_START=46 /DNA_END=387 /DNA_ORIENTATION=-
MTTSHGIPSSYQPVKRRRVGIEDLQEDFQRLSLASRTGKGELHDLMGMLTLTATKEPSCSTKLQTGSSDAEVMASAEKSRKRSTSQQEISWTALVVCYTGFDEARMSAQRDYF